MKTLFRTATTTAFATLLALAAFVPPAAAQQNSPEATAAAQRYRASKAAAQPASAAASAAKKSAKKGAKPAAAPANANAGDWNAQLVACKSDAGMNLIKREKCVYAHCKGHWGEGECPPGQDLPTKDSFKNPFKRSGS